MNPLHLHTLLAIVDEGSFESAALVLGISASAVSQRVKALEKSAGRVLLRRANPVTTTDAGEVMVQAARRMALLQAETEAQLQGRLARIPLAVAINADSLATWFKPVLAEVARIDNASLHLRIEDESATLTLLRRGDVLGAVTREEAPVSGCESIRLGTMRYFSVAHPQLLAQYTTAGKIDWEYMPALRFGPRDSLQSEDLRNRVAHPVRQRRISQIPSAEAFIEAARVGLGWALLPEEDAVALVDAGDVVRLDDSVVETTLYWQRWRLESPALEQLTSAVLNAAKELR
ncbi:LysR-family transcriptional regulator [Corynebacterium kutscheri]|uniref:LysR-family transcriptional regulator n=1 Tax=Corynebacterium kutscheri TaxID=35755 RepID=A0A0F6TDB4_9CORY|nr:LysR family transcriptional regulator ArgP [Corynebacterium kutscheri]AKE41026.1 transcriptional regulator, ArgP family [Corynebacterium kutscheri]VEH06916.1 LysR-family transcriptional regulator [Corynebacterium kutscheri]VEH09324.1 LysR-family transcriptional regulator [Corynebacterium kutscheri]VEH79412.1 LysR-family transcriptional regulator [Corynebacterium kutscheri]